jgi:hypothetical protein
VKLWNNAEYLFSFAINCEKIEVSNIIHLSNYIIIPVSPRAVLLSSLNRLRNTMGKPFAGLKANDFNAQYARFPQSKTWAASDQQSAQTFTLCSLLPQSLTYTQLVARTGEKRKTSLYIHGMTAKRPSCYNAVKRSDVYAGPSSLHGKGFVELAGVLCVAICYFSSFLDTSHFSGFGGRVGGR